MSPRLINLTKRILRARSVIAADVNRASPENDLLRGVAGSLSHLTRDIATLTVLMENEGAAWEEILAHLENSS